MSVGLVIISHDEVGASLLHAATSMLGMCPLHVALVTVHRVDDPDHILSLAQRRLQEVDAGEGVLVLTDMFGSTPSNVAARLRDWGDIRVIAGLNLPMLVRILNYPRLSLDELTRKAVEGGRDGVLSW